MTARLKLKTAPRMGTPREPETPAAGTKAKRRRAKSVAKNHPDREGQFLKLFNKLAEGWTAPVPQFVFHNVRKWRFDFAWPGSFVAVEIDGGIFQEAATGHRSIGGVMRDSEKSNAAQLLGWCVLRFHAKDLDKRPAQVIDDVKRALRLAGGQAAPPES